MNLTFTLIFPFIEVSSLFFSLWSVHWPDSPALTLLQRWSNDSPWPMGAFQPPGSQPLVQEEAPNSS